MSKGEYGRVLEAGMEHSGRSVHTGTGQRSARQKCARSKDGREDSEWLAELLQHGLLAGSFVPPRLIRDLRDLTRTRAALTQESSRLASRIQKVLEDANIKLASVASDTLGKSGQAILAALIAGQDDPEQLADLALGTLRGKMRNITDSS
jgi:transposase